MGSKRRDILLAMGETDLLAHDADYKRSFNFGIRPDIAVYHDMATLWTKHPDAVFICTPPETHLDLAWQAYIHGVQGIFIEKPLATEMPCDVFRLLSDNVTMVGCNWRWSELAAEADRLVRRADHNLIYAARLYVHYHLPTVRCDYRESYAATTGALFDVGWHIVDLALDWFGPATLEDVLLASAEEIGLPDTVGAAYLELAHDSGLSSFVAASFTKPGYRVGWMVDGSGTGKRYQSHQTPDDSMFVAETCHFLDCVREGKQTVNTIGKARETLRILLEAKERWLEPPA